MAKKVQFTTNQPSASTDYLAADNTWKTIPGGGGGSGTVTSVAVTVPPALSVTGSPITTYGTIAITGAGTSSEYIKGDGTLGTTPTSLPPSGSAGGDLSGTYPNPNVSKIHGVDMQSGTPATDEVWVYGGSPAKWQHQKLHASQTTNDSTVSGTNVDNALDNLKSAIALKQDTITGAATTVVSSNLTPSRVVVSNGGGKLDVAVTTTTEIGYLSGVTSNVQTQLDSKASVSRSFMAVNQNATVVLSSITYGSFIYSGLNTAELSRVFVVPYACTMKNFYVRMFSAQSGTGSLVFTLRKNQADTAVVVTIAAGSAANTEANSGVTTATFSGGDDCTIKIVNNATAVSGTINNTSIMIEI